MDIVHFSLHFHWPGGAGRSTENGDRLSDSAITPMAMVSLTQSQTVGMWPTKNGICQAPQIAHKECKWNVTKPCIPSV